MTDPRIQRTHAKVMAAVRDSLSEVGYDATTMEGIAARAGVGKATVYRHWPSKAELVIDAANHLRDFTVPRRPGPVGERLAGLYEELSRYLNDSGWAACLPTMLDAASRDPDMDELYSAFITARRAPAADMVTAGVQSGELPEDTDVDATLDMMAGPIFYRRFIARRMLRPGDAAEIVRRVLADPPRSN